MKEKEQNLKAQMVKAKEAFQQMPKKTKIISISVLSAVVLIAIIATVVLNIGKNQYRILYEGLEAQEKNTIYSMLQEMGVPAQRNQNGDIMVPASEYDRTLLELATKGYPHSAPAYGLFESHTGLTSTEAENKQWILYQLQDRLQTTLKTLNGVSNAIVTIDMPQDSTYVWEQGSQESQSSASVTLTLTSALKPNQVSAIKNLVASGVPRLTPENVKVIDARTLRELQSEEQQDSQIDSTQKGFAFEQQVQTQLEQNAIRALAPRYGANGVFAVAKVVIDYDKMMTEQMTLQGKDDGTGFTKEFGEQYTVDGNVQAGAIVGEESNTDIPNQAFNTQEQGDELTKYNRNIKYDYGYIKTQIERGNAVLKSGTISVMVAEDNMTELRREELIDLVSKGTGINKEDISVSPVNPDAVPKPKEPQKDTNQNEGFTVPMWVSIAAGVAVLLAILLIVFFVLRSKNKKYKQERERERLKREMEEQRAQMEREIEDYKRELSDAAMANTNPKDEAIVNEVRDFAKQNPEITANLLRAWLKEGDE